jgi:hypothetical protein
VTAALEALAAHVTPHLEAVLRETPEGLSEYELIAALRVRGVTQFQREAFANSLSLFQSHFILFHFLYRFDDVLRATGQGHLAIHCLCIRWMLPDLAAGIAQSPELPDSGLRAYYLNPAHLHETSAQDVDALITAFWLRFVSTDERHAALTILELQDPVDDATVERQYRRLAQRLHPDRGGDTAAFQQLSSAMRVLRR